MNNNKRLNKVLEKISSVTLGINSQLSVTLLSSDQRDTLHHYLECLISDMEDVKAWLINIKNGV